LSPFLIPVFFVILGGGGADGFWHACQKSGPPPPPHTHTHPSPHSPPPARPPPILRRSIHADVQYSAIALRKLTPWEEDSSLSWQACKISALIPNSLVRAPVRPIVLKLQRASGTIVRVLTSSQKVSSAIVLFAKFFLTSLRLNVHPSFVHAVSFSRVRAYISACGRHFGINYAWRTSYRWQDPAASAAYISSPSLSPDVPHSQRPAI
jgi:hypothetical protein